MAWRGLFFGGGFMRVLRFWLACLVLFAAPAFAGYDGSGPFVQQAVGSATVGYGGAASSDFARLMRAPANPLNAVTVADTVKMTGPFGKAVELTAERTISKGALAVAGRVAMKVFMPLAIGKELWDYYKENGGTVDGNGAPTMDPGADRVDGFLYCFSGGNAACALTPSALCAQQPPPGDSSMVAPGSVFYIPGDTYGSCNGMKFQYPPYTVGGFTYQSPVQVAGPYGFYRKAEKICPDDGHGGYGRPINGKPCGTRDTAPATDEAIEGVLKGLSGQRAQDVLREITEKWPSTQPGAVPKKGDKPADFPGPETGPTTLKGPASEQGPSSTTTKPDGSVVTSNQVANYTYNNSTVTWNITNVTNNGGDITTETSDPQPTDCDKNPDLIGCSKYGSPESDNLPRTPVPFDLKQVNMGGNASCPADRDFSVYGQSYSLKLSPVCDATTRYVKPIVLVMCAFLSAYIFAAGFKV